MLVRPADRREDRRAVGDVERHREHRVAMLAHQVVQDARVSRAVAATRSPRSSAATVHSRPKPRDAPVMNHVLLAIGPA